MPEPAHYDRLARPHFQFSLRMLLLITAVVAVVVAVSLSYYRRHAAGQRAMLLVQAMHSGNVKEVDQLLKADPRLAHGREHGTARSSHTAEALLAHGAQHERDAAIEEAHDPKLKNGPRYLEILHAATRKSPAGR